MEISQAPTLLALQADIWSDLERIKGSKSDINQATKYLFQFHGVSIGSVDHPKLAMAHAPLDLLVHLQMILRVGQVYVQSSTYSHIPGSDSQDPPVGREQDNLLSPTLLHEMLRLLIEFLSHLVGPAGGQRGALDPNIYRPVVCTIHAAIRIAYLHPRRPESFPELIKIAESIDVILDTLSEKALSEEWIGLIVCDELIKRPPVTQRSRKPYLFDINIQLYPLDHSAIAEKIDEVMMEYQNVWLDSYWTIYDILCGVSGAILQHGAHKSTSQCDFGGVSSKIAEMLSNHSSLGTGKALDRQVGLSLQKLSSHAVSLRDQVLRQRGQPDNASEIAQTPAQAQEQLELYSLMKFPKLVTRQDIAGQGPEDVTSGGVDAYELESCRPIPALVGTPRHPELTRPMSGRITGFQTGCPSSPNAGAESLAPPSTAHTTVTASVASGITIVGSGDLDTLEVAPRNAKGPRRVCCGIPSWFRRFSCF